MLERAESSICWRGLERASYSCRELESGNDLERAREIAGEGEGWSWSAFLLAGLRILTLQERSKNIKKQAFQRIIPSL